MHAPGTSSEIRVRAFTGTVSANQDQWCQSLYLDALVKLAAGAIKKACHSPKAVYGVLIISPHSNQTSLDRVCVGKISDNGEIVVHAEQNDIATLIS